MVNLQELTIKKLGGMFRNKETTVLEIAEMYLKHIAEKNGDINAYVEVYDDVKEQALRAQEMIDNNEATLLTGIPIALKDNILIKGKRVSAASKILEHYVAPYDAYVIEKLKTEGVVFLGRTNLDEFAMGGSTENSVYGVTKNPYDTSRVAGGSSGGSAAAVSENMALTALGSDTGGSIRQPASFCNVVGLKPTYGSVSRSGLIAMGSSLDVIGPITKTVTDAEIIFNAIKGKDTFDSTSHNGEWTKSAVGGSLLNAKVSGEQDVVMTDNSSDELSRGIKETLKKVIGVPRDFLNVDGIDGDVKENFEASLEKMKQCGYELRDVDMPTLPLSLAVYYILMPAEVSSNLSRFDGVKYGLHVDGTDLLDDYVKTRGRGFGKEARRRILVGTYVLSSGYYDAYYRKALMARNKIKKEFEDVFQDIDVVALPTSPVPAFKIGEKSDPLSLYLADIFTVSANIAGVPGISLPSGMIEREGVQLPVGFQLLASYNREDILFSYGKDFLREE